MDKELKKQVKELARKKRREEYQRAKEIKKQQLEKMKQDPEYQKRQAEQKEQAKKVRRQQYELAKKFENDRKEKAAEKEQRKKEVLLKEKQDQILAGLRPASELSEISIDENNADNLPQKSVSSDNKVKEAAKVIDLYFTSAKIKRASELEN